MDQCTITIGSRVIAFDGDEWFRVGHDVGDNSCFWKPATVVSLGRWGKRLEPIADDRANGLIGTPFVHLPERLSEHQVLFECEGVKVCVGIVEMMFNDALLLDAVSSWGEDGPLYRDTLDTPIERSIFWKACELYRGVTLPSVYKMPCCAGTRVASNQGHKCSYTPRQE